MPTIDQTELGFLYPIETVIPTPVESEMQNKQPEIKKQPEMERSPEMEKSPEVKVKLFQKIVLENIS